MNTPNPARPTHHRRTVPVLAGGSSRPVLIAGCIALDEIHTPTEVYPDLAGGSAAYAALSASYFAPVNLVGVVGADFPRRYLDLFRVRGIDLTGLEIVDGRTFRWVGEYETDMNRRRTRRVDLNAFGTFRPVLPAAYRQTPFVLLANMSPKLQADALDQVQSPQFVVADTMDLWISGARADLVALLPRLDLFVVNEDEARQLTGRGDLDDAGRDLLQLGPRHVVIKKGEHGCVLMSVEETFNCRAFPAAAVQDPTGAGDAFVGCLVGALAAQNVTPITFRELKEAVVHACVLASFCVESLSVDRLAALSDQEIRDRHRSLVAMDQSHAAMI